MRLGVRGRERRHKVYATDNFNFHAAQLEESENVSTDRATAGRSSAALVQLHPDPWRIHTTTRRNYPYRCRAPRGTAVSMRGQTRAWAAGAAVHRIVMQVLTPGDGARWPTQDNRRVIAHGQDLMGPRQRKICLGGDSHVWGCTSKLKGRYRLPAGEA